MVHCFFNTYNPQLWHWQRFKCWFTGIKNDSQLAQLIYFISLTPFIDMFLNIKKSECLNRIYLKSNDMANKSRNWTHWIHVLTPPPPTPDYLNCIYLFIKYFIITCTFLLLKFMLTLQYIFHYLFEPRIYFHQTLQRLLMSD